jgi:AraC family transcriptional regulator
MKELGIVTLEAKRLVGIKMAMSFVENRTFELWSSFMQRRDEVKHAVGNERYSVQKYPPGFYRSFDPRRPFEKWAAVEVTAVDEIPTGMEMLSIPKGQYAVFLYRGDHTNAASAFQYIFFDWLPRSGFELDNRHHFEKLGEKYRRDDPESEEEIWIPVTA